MNLANTQHLLFDLGGVIINLEPKRTAMAFAQLSGMDVETVSRHLKEIDLFGKYEVGEWNDEEFREAVRKLLQIELTDAQLDKAWNAMLLDIPPMRIELLKRLRSKFNLFLLSNTNNIHLTEVNRILHRTTGIKVLEDLFDRTFYSHLIGRSKPTPATYQFVLEQAGITASETLFLDDNAENILGAQQSGLQTVLIQPNTYTILDCFPNV